MTGHKDRPVAGSILSERETELVARAQRGDRSAFAELVSRHYDGVIRVVYRLCGDADLAQDAAQAAFIQAWTHLPGYQPRAPLRNWLYRIAVNAALQILRPLPPVAWEAVEELQLVDPQPSPEAALLREERAALVQKAVMVLPPASRAVLVLREFEGLSYQEIASALDIPLGTVMSRLNYARVLLRELLARQLGEAEVENV
jgi:RNA polymerase sigma-70 factor (ECF subfamily)